MLEQNVPNKGLFAAVMSEIEDMQYIHQAIIVCQLPFYKIIFMFSVSLE